MRVFLSKIFSSKEAKPKHVLMFLVPLFIFSLVLTLTPHPTYAQSLDFIDPANWIKWILERISEFFYATGYDLISLGYHLVVSGANASMNLVSNPAITTEWQNTKAATLDLFGLAVIAIAFMNMMKFKIEEWGFQRLIPKLVMTAFFVYFSKFICSSIINLSVALTKTLAKKNLDQFDIYMNNIGLAMSKGDVPSLPVSVGIFLIAVLTFLMLLLLAAILFVRGFILGMLIVISPLAFGLIALPATQPLFKKFWDMFIKWTIFLPICFFVLSIGLGFMAASNSIFTSEEAKTPFAQAIHDDEGKGEEVIQALDAFLLGAVSIPMAVFLPLGFLGAVGSHISSMAKKTGKAGVNLLPATVNPKAWQGWAKQRSSNIAARKQEKLGGQMRKSFGRIPGVGGRIIGESAQDQINLNRDLADKFGNLGMSNSDRRKYARGTLDRSKLGDDVQKSLKDWEKRGGNKGTAIDHLVKEGALDYEAATDHSVKAHIMQTGNYDEALKKSNLHQLRSKDFSTIGHSVGDMITPDIKGDGGSNPGLLKHQLIGGTSITDSMLTSLKADSKKAQQASDLREQMLDMANNRNGHSGTTRAEAAELHRKATLLT
ncbi:MAG: type IV secretion system protein [bacterium]|nr:type IV secretion system protein [bacterium]